MANKKWVIMQPTPQPTRRAVVPAAYRWFTSVQHQAPLPQENIPVQAEASLQQVILPAQVEAPLPQENLPVQVEAPPSQEIVSYQAQGPPRVGLLDAATLAALAKPVLPDQISHTPIEYRQLNAIIKNKRRVSTKQTPTQLTLPAHAQAPIPQEIVLA